MVCFVLMNLDGIRKDMEGSCESLVSGLPTKFQVLICK